MTKFSIILPYLSNSRCVDTCKKLLYYNTVNEYELIEIIDNTDVYKAFNDGVHSANNDIVILLNDDMFVSYGWDEHFLQYCKPNTVVTGYVVEPGRLPVSDKNIKYDCGTSPETFDYIKFNSFTEKQKKLHPTVTADLGWYMPVAFYKPTFIEYPNHIRFPHPNDIELFHNILPKLNYNFIKVNSFIYHLQNYSNPIISQKKQIIDCFPFFDEKELLELRINLLKNYVDQFVILEANRTHSGKDKKFICNELINELGLPKQQIEVIQVDIPKYEDLIPSESDIVYAKEAKSDRIKNWTIERMQRDAIMQSLHNYSDDTVFLLSDCDEIIDPKFLTYFANICRDTKNNYIKVPLVSLEGRADQRLYLYDNPYDWNRSMVLCTKQQLSNNGSPTKFRGEYNSPLKPVWITDNNQIVKECGWHFTWMGGNDRQLTKYENTVLSGNLSAYNNLSSSSMKNICNIDQNSYIIAKPYPLKKLPQIIFDLPRVRQFLLP